MHENWQQLDQLFAQALALSGEDRLAFLERLEAQQPTLHATLLQLLKEDAQGTGLLDQNASTFIATLLSEIPPEPSSALPQKIGGYTVIRQLGQGGMGVVYLAERTLDGFSQTVAIKVLKQGLDTEAVTRRFRQERAVLAALQHPNIARLIDGGTTSDGRPYFVMEYIEGQPITAYCDAQHCSIEERLAFFETVCDTVQFAHQNLVVHRDLKPSNILVADDGTVKLLDFGIAKMLEGHDVDLSLIETVPAERLLTPAYASPEQLQGSMITTASDVYALGVLLYELLVGRRPFSQPYREVLEQVVLQRDVVRPSKAVTSIIREEETETKSTWLLEARQTNYERLRRRLRGDLDVICLKALSQEVERRYGTAGSLGDDIRRHLAGMPVEAQPDSLKYRSQKFIRRHRWGVGMALGILVLIVVFSWFYNIRITAERDRAVQAAVKADAVKTFMVELFSVSSPDVAQGDSLLARTVLDAGAARIRTELEDQPEVQAELMSTMGGIYTDLGLLEEADTLLQEALRRQRLLFPDPHADLAQTLTFLTHNTYILGDIPPMVRYMEEAVSIVDVLHSDADEEVLSAKGNLAIIYEVAGEEAAAESLYQAVLADVRTHLGEAHPEYSRNLANLAEHYRLRGDFDQALPLAQEALALEREQLGSKHPFAGDSMRNIAHLLEAKGDYIAADSVYRKTVALFQEVYSDQHPRTGDALCSWGRVAFKMNNLPEAEQRLAQGRASLQAVLDEDHYTISICDAVQGLMRLQQQRYQEAEALLTTSYPILNASHEVSLVVKAETRQGLIELYTYFGDAEQAEHYRSQAE